MAEADPLNSPPETTISLDAFKVVSLDLDELAVQKVVAFDSHDIRSRPFNLLRTRIAKITSANGTRLIGLTSATPGEGKSFLSLNLAASLAQLAESPVYLVDLDLRHASIGEELGLTVELGVGDFLKGSVTDLTDIGMRINDLPLVVFPTRVENKSAQYLARDTFARLIDLLRKAEPGSIVVFDLPPVFANDDAMICAEALDGYVLVVNSGKTNRRQIKDSMEMLQPAPCLGTIMNRYNGGMLDPYGYGSGKYSVYYSS
ncbi:MAG: CpsD/CapB family tyrosine-protein kinase [Novosphingobium sp.]